MSLHRNKDEIELFSFHFVSHASETRLYDSLLDGMESKKMIDNLRGTLSKREGEKIFLIVILHFFHFSNSHKIIFKPQGTG